MKIIGLFSALSVALGGSLSAANIFTPGDFIIAIDVAGGSQSSSPGSEPASAVLDGNPGTKYLNFGEERSGFIVTPASGSSVVQSMRFTTANDAEERDPASYSLYGTNDPILSLNHSLGNGESWSLISTGGLSLPSTRQALSGAIDLANATGFSSYRLIFDTVKDAAAANSMQIADVQFYTGLGATGSSVLATGDAILAIDLDFNPPNSSFPDGEPPSAAIDGTLAKYLNFGQAGSGFIITPSVGPSIVDGFTVTTANDSEGRDPQSYSIFGTNDPITSLENSDGGSENWALIQSGQLGLPSARDTAGSPIAIANGNAYSSYRVVFDTVKDVGENSMQIAEIQFSGTIIPEPSVGLLALFATLPLLRRRRA